MECVYFPELSTNDKTIIIDGEEANHLKVLRLKDGSPILVSNGKGICATGNTVRLKKDVYQVNILDFHYNYGESARNVSIAMPILDNRERFEYAIEKAVELGIYKFLPFFSQRCQSKRINYDRLEKKAISAMKQCNRSVLPKIEELKSLQSLTEVFAEYKSIVLADFSSNNENIYELQYPCLCIVGPEGGFNEDEINLLHSYKDMISVNLGNSILRSETAALALLSYVFFTI